MRRGYVMKLDIIGSVASGKTTLARNLSETYELQMHTGWIRENE